MDKRMVTRRNRLDYFLLGDGSDDEALPEDRIPETAQSVINLSPDIPSSEIHFDTPRVSVTDTLYSQWLCSWWHLYRDEFPQMAAAARDYLAIPASRGSSGEVI